MTPSASSRRRSLGLATGALSALLALSLTGSVVSAASAAPGTGNGGSNGGGKNTTTPTATVPTGALACHTLPDAAALPTERGRTINTLHPYQGRVYYGYGDYNANTGSMAEPYGMNVSSFDPATGTTRVHLSGFKTEEVHVFRTFDEHLYVPNIDPSRGADFYNSYASNAGEPSLGAAPGTWAENPGAHASVHVYDVAKVGGDLFVAGSSEWENATDGAAIIWRSTDGGATWMRTMEETEDDPALRNGFERYYWMGVIGTKVYTRAQLNLPWPDIAPLRVYDTATGTWATVADGSDTTTRFGAYVYEANQVVSWRDRLWTADGALMWFDGTRTVRVGGSRKSSAPSIAALSVGDDGLLYGADLDGSVYRIGDATPKKGKGAKQGSGLTFTKVGAVDAGARRPFTVAGNQIWAAADYGTARVCSYRLG